jgi:hypothetical protein
MICKKCKLAKGRFIKVASLTRNGLLDEYWCVNCVVEEAIWSKFKGGERDLQHETP